MSAGRFVVLAADRAGCVWEPCAPFHDLREALTAADTFQEHHGRERVFSVHDDEFPEAGAMSWADVDAMGYNS
jgi:hypothetical protein